MDKKKVLTRIISMSAAAVVLTGAGVGTGTDFLSTMNVSAVVTAGDYEYTETEDGIAITGYIGEGKRIEIPSKLNSRKVVSVEENTFRNNHSISYVNIPDTVREIKDNAFDGCDHLKAVVLGKQVEAVSDNAFDGTDSQLILYGKNEGYVHTYAENNDIAYCTAINDDGCSVSANSVMCGSILRCSAKFKDGIQPYQYRYSYRVRGSDQWIYAGDTVSEPEYSITMPRTAGIYEVRISAKDANGVTASKIMNVTVQSNTGTRFGEKNLSVSSTSIDTGKTLSAFAEVKGGIEPYSFRYTYQPYGTPYHTFDTGYISDSSRKISFPQKPGIYVMSIEAKDAVGHCVSKTMNIAVKQATGKPISSDGTTLSHYSVWTGQTITANVNAQGGTLPYCYKFSYKAKGSSDWIYESSYGYEKSRRIKMPTTPGVYTVRAAAKDANNQYTSQYIDITVRKDTGTEFEESGSNVSKTSVEKSETIIAKAVFTGGVAPYRYKYSYRYQSGEWCEVTGYITDSTQSIRIPSQPGKYTVRIAAQDAKGEYRSKYLYVMNNAINIPEVFLKQHTNYTCTLAANTMMLRRKAILNGSASWQSITEENCRPKIWCEGAGMLNTYTYNGVRVVNKNIQSYASRRQYLMEELKKHPEGIVIYEYDIPHAILLTDYTDGIFYVADPARNTPNGRIPISQTRLNIDTVDAIWFIP